MVGEEVEAQQGEPQSMRVFSNCKANKGFYGTLSGFCPKEITWVEGYRVMRSFHVGQNQLVALHES